MQSGPHGEILRLMRAGDWRAANAACRVLNSQYPRFAAGWQAASQTSLRLGQVADALEQVEHALAIEPDNPKFQLLRAQCLLLIGRSADACEAAAAAQRGAANDAAVLNAIGGLYNLANEQRRALIAYDQAVALMPDNALFIFNRAAVRRFLGQLMEAEQDYDRVIALNPTDYEAYRNRSDLRTQSTDSNHIAELLRVAQHVSDWNGEVQLQFALAKEYEDLGDYEQSFQHLRQGARVRREHLRYDVARDLATVDWIIQADARLPASAAPDARGEAPIFIVGLPRSGSTLVDRILGSHSAVHSAGELKHLALAIVDAVRARSGAAQLSRQQLVDQSVSLDLAALGRDYLDRVRRGGVPSKRFTDKMPLNYLYCGLIRRALPNARIVHVSRSPMAACYAIYKTLFKDGYPYSYDLEELARYYVGYRRLMDHWNATLPGAIHSLSYEDLVADQLGQTRRLLEFCRLDWEDACAQFHHNPSPTTTASAAQVRRPLYDTSVSQWRHYRRQLAQVSGLLRGAGIELPEVSD